MQNYTLPDSCTYKSQGSSEGTQTKFFMDGKWFKQDLNGYEGEVECLVSCLLDCSNIDNYVQYEECMINGKRGCVSDNFLKENEMFITFERLHQMYTGRHMIDEVMVLGDTEERINYVKDFVFKHTGLDISNYLSNVFAVDALVLNYDRHFNNLGVIYDSEKDSYREAPIFDNGAGLLSNISRFPAFQSIEENTSHIAGQPICANLDLQAYYAGIKLKIDYDAFETKYFPYFENSRAVEVLKYQLEQQKSLFPDFKKFELEEER